MTTALNRITHVNYVLDASYSMEDHATNLVKVVDGHIQHLADRSRSLDQDIHISVYDFADDVRCLIYDRDVLRLPSIAKLYRPRGNTALIDATLQSLEELARTAQIHGEHAFLTYVVTDGQENRSRRQPAQLRTTLSGLAKNWTVACMVPDAMGKDDAMAYGFAPDNIAIWNPSGRRGVEEAGAVMAEATDIFLENRGKGVVGTRSLFSTGADAVNAATVQATLAPLDPAAYDVIPVDRDDYIRPFVESRGLRYTIGSGYYELTKRETIGSRKRIAIREKRGQRRVFTGVSARDLLGLGGNDVRVSPDYNPDYSIHVQSTSVNRRLVAGTDLLILR
jgi:hypothetical protein